METKMKGLLRGLRYISQIFDNKEQEMQIGYPTDVKHVAHIGWDGPSAAAAPSWMNEFQSAPATNGEGGTDSPSGEQQQPPDAPPGRHSRRNASAGNVSVVDSPSRDSSLPEGSRRGRRHHTTAAGGGGGGSGSSESAASLDETPAVPKQSRRRKPKGSSSSSVGGGGSTRSGRSKAAPASHSDPGIDNCSGDLPAPLSPTREEDGF
ncbi:CRIB domain-containing protein RIC5-like [Ananas comosus]|uniref:CRIB domain-containing protein RIC5-like n=1 Tax=Ananas comosus TaxID=4615 RepID=A0A6P5GV15_ANACO|nr:CRIB domain-containing protein RIC5-like [Ananas comosus]XP_020112491.1 CRIB domain-containing protein RIC5-like [Ananas comosus]XP_020112492.1 CRIB domain-containing protein RIC5-like [Ananas comosus]